MARASRKRTAPRPRPAPKPARPLILRARQVPSSVACARCDRRSEVTEPGFGNIVESRRLVPLPAYWRLWLCLEQHACGPEHWMLLCPGCTAELVGNQGDFMPGKGEVIDEGGGR